MDISKIFGSDVSVVCHYAAIWHGESDINAANLTFADNTKITPEIAKQDPDLIPMDQLNDEQFDAHIQGQLSNDVAEQETV